MKKTSIQSVIAVFLLVSLMLQAVAVLCIHVWQNSPLTSEHASTSAATGKRPILVIDPGHGGEDGGAMSEDGIPEKTLNLQVAEILSDILRLSGYDVRMTRTDDRMLYDLYNDLTDYSRKKKTYDLRNRVRFCQEAQPDAFISIHMNQFPEKQYRGLQVYYSPNAVKSEGLASAIQNYTKMYLQPENHREIKSATSSIYLLKHIQIPAVLVECGFLSNPEEQKLLQNTEYQRQLALTMACAIGESVFQTGNASCNS